MDFTHINPQGRAVMVDVTAKAPTYRTAVAEATLRCKPETVEAIRSGGVKKGDVLAVAQVAGIQAAKRTWELIPLCHPLPLTGIDLAFDLTETAVHITATVRCTGPTGVEMEALTAASAAALTVYDMCKALQKDMEITAVRLLEKTGGKSGAYRMQHAECRMQNEGSGIKDQGSEDGGGSAFSVQGSACHSERSAAKSKNPFSVGAVIGRPQPAPIDGMQNEGSGIKDQGSGGGSAFKVQSSACHSERSAAESKNPFSVGAVIGRPQNAETSAAAGSVIAVCVSEQKGVQKHPVEALELRVGHGIVGDAHAGNWHRQVSLLAEESVNTMRGLGFELPPGIFAENILTRGINLKALPVGTVLRAGTALLAVTQIGKECHNDCEIKRSVGRCVMPTDGIFAVVLQDGAVRAGDTISIDN